MRKYELEWNIVLRLFKSEIYTTNGRKQHDLRLISVFVSFKNNPKITFLSKNFGLGLCDPLWCYRSTRNQIASHVLLTLFGFSNFSFLR